MRNSRRRIAFNISVLSLLTLLIAVMPYVTNSKIKSKASTVDPSIGEISYYQADLFDYESSKRSANGNFLLGDQELNSDAALVLFNQENYYVKPEDFGQESVPRPSEHNSWISSYKYKVVQGLVQKQLGAKGTLLLANNRVAVSGDKKVKLFDDTDTTTFKGSYSFPFENIGDGYLQYDSSKNHVQVTDEINSSQLLNMMRYDVASSTGFMPFNKLNTSKDPDENGQYALSGNRNFYFGMKVEVPFVMTKGGKITTYDGKESDMMFKFSGDDDMWVFVDGQLVLDLGGVHDKVTGDINFATGVVRTVGNHYDADTGKYKTNVTTETSSNTYIKSLSVGRHSLQVFFLERGGHVSNCKMTFRLQEDKTPDETPKPEDEIVGPTEEPTPEPTEEVTPEPSVEPTEEVTPEPSVEPTEEVTPEPSVEPTEEATPEPSVEPTEEVVPEPSVEPEKPTNAPIEGPLDDPTEQPEDIVTPTEPTDDEGNVDVDDDDIDTQPKEEDDEEVKPVPDEDTSLDSSDDDDDEVIDGGGKNNGVLDKVKDIIDNTIPEGVLPKTGTISDTLLYVVGALLIIVGAVILVIYVRKKKR